VAHALDQRAMVRQLQVGLRHRLGRDDAVTREDAGMLQRLLQGVDARGTLRMATRVVIPVALRPDYRHNIARFHAASMPHGARLTPPALLSRRFVRRGSPATRTPIVASQPTIPLRAPRTSPGRPQEPCLFIIIGVGYHSQCDLGWAAAGSPQRCPAKRESRVEQGSTPPLICATTRARRRYPVRSIPSGLRHDLAAEGRGLPDAPENNRVRRIGGGAVLPTADSNRAWPTGNVLLAADNNRVCRVDIGRVLVATNRNRRFPKGIVLR